MNRHPTLAYGWGTNFFENRYPLFGIMPRGVWRPRQRLILGVFAETDRRGSRPAREMRWKGSTEPNGRGVRPATSRTSIKLRKERSLPAGQTRSKHLKT